jgi:hypothetical protein
MFSINYLQKKFSDKHLKICIKNFKKAANQIPIIQTFLF